jgi:uncharacterized protein involved in response to NO
MTDQPAPTEIIYEEPFRIFFPLGILCGLAGISLWFGPYLGLGLPHSGLYHGLLQIQGFIMAFAVGFLMTSLPRFMEAPRSRWWEILLNAVLLLGNAIALYLGAWRLAEYLFLALVIHMLLFVLQRFVKREDNPPPAFVLAGFGLLCALAGGWFLLHPLSGFSKMGQSMLEQGMLLGFVMAVGSHLGPRLLYGNRHYPDTEGPEFRKKLWIFLGTGLLLFLSFPLEAGFSLLWGRLLRGLVVTAYLLAVVRIHRPPSRPLLHLYLLWFSFWCVPTGQWLVALSPTYEMTALHVTFIGGFGLMTLVIATRVIVAHCNFDEMWEVNSWKIAIPGILFILALLVRIGADLVPQYYLDLLSTGAGIWLVGALAWGAIFAPKVGPSNISPDD